jgi:hypothetical protein
MTTQKLSDVDESLWSGPNISRAFEIPPSGVNQIMGWDFASKPDETVFALLETPKRFRQIKWIMPTRMAAQNANIRQWLDAQFHQLTEKLFQEYCGANTAMQAADLTTTGHEVHYATCPCGKDFKFTNSFLCPECEKAEAERLRRYSHENKLFRANGVFK